MTDFEPHDLPPEDAAGPEPGDAPGADAQGGRAGLDALWRSRLDLNDLGNARRLHAHAKGVLLWIEEKEAWVAFDGVRWTRETGKAFAASFAHKVADGLHDEYLALMTADLADVQRVYGRRFTDDMRQKRGDMLISWATKSGEASKANAMLVQARGLVGGNSGGFLMQAALADFDADPLAYHCTNGVVRFVRVGAPDPAGHAAEEIVRFGGWAAWFIPGHRASDMMMQMAAVAFDRRAVARAWIDRLEVMQRDPVAREALQRVYGMTLTGLISDQAFYIFQGKGQDGKSTGNDVVGDLHGDYFRRASPKSFLQGPARGGAEHQSDIVRLMGDIRMVVIDEPQARSTWDGERIKQATGSAFTARGVGAKDEVTFTPRWKLIAECNELPKAPSDDRGFRRRFKLLPFMVQFGITPGVPDDPVHEVKARLKAELPGLLNWMIMGALRWLEEGHVPEPEMSARAVASFWDSASPMGDFLQARCDMTDPAATIGATELYNAFRQFCIDRGDDEAMIMKQAGFGRKLNTLQIYGEKDARGNTVRVGIRLAAAGGAGASQGGAGGDGPGAGDDGPVPGWDDALGAFDG